MAYNKVVYNNNTLIDLTSDTVTADKLMEGYTAHDKSGALITGTATGGSGDGYVWQDAQGYVHLSDEEGTQPIVDSLTVSGSGTYNAPTGHVYNPVTVPSGSASTPATSITANPSISVSNSGLITVTASATKSVTPSVSAGWVSNGTSGTVTVSGSNTSQLSTESGKTVTPTTSEQTAVASGKYTTGAIKVAAMPSGTAGTPTATKGTVSNHSVSVTPSVTNTTGYIIGSTKTGTAVTVSASELVSGTKSITNNGTGIDVTNYASVDVSVSGGGGLEYETGIWTPTEDISSENIYFANTHTNKPCMFMLSDTTGTYSDMTNTNYAISYVNYYDAFGVNLYASTTSVQIGLVRYVYRATNATSLTAGNSNLTTTEQADDWVSNTHIIAHSNSTSRYWRAGRSYKWIAVWAPTT